MTNSSSVDVVIIGGGITGLSLAWYLQQRGAQQGQPISYALLESSNRWGGKILTEQLTQANGESFVVEGGPDSFITQKPWGLQLARELGLSEALLPTNDQKRQVFVLNAIETALPPGLFVTGSPYRGVGVPDCVHQAQETAARVATRLKT